MYDHDENERVRDLDPSTAIDVCYGSDGVSDDCITTDAAALSAAGFGALRYEGDEWSPTVWVSRRKFEQIAEAVG